MGKKYSIAQARDQLARVVREAEGEPIELTRRGEPVAVMVSLKAYSELRGESPSLWKRLEQFRMQVLRDGIEDVFDDVRDTSVGRDPQTF
ncbi:MAG: hypothetical protein A2289_08030 [Deltaproteobacteria bacterium RIFOXYA12_FULL_58_15]|nr:MAG: hypothetical protein A2289_08030 [Deltaproteobacteria bacterium RIFOXYA12_FULL_58_15]OGR10352.1 MAG: hypothetical protein A2341_22810 [Deltaproteobacteria bacterium RIFOXYB12_FULL_58_9]